MRKLGTADYLTMPWKNGGGSTTQLAISPPGADLSNFDWRISMARVESAGPFSIFPGIDRSLAVLDGGGLRLEPEGDETVMLTAQGEPFVFPGEKRIHAELLDGPITDFNVMTRRARVAHELQMLHLSGMQRHTLQSDLKFIYCVQGYGVHIRCTAGETDCAGGEAILLDRRDGGEIDISAPSPVRLFIARLTFKGAPDAE